MPFYEYNDPTKLDKKKYDEYKEALTGSPITDSKSFQVLFFLNKKKKKKKKKKKEKKNNF